MSLQVEDEISASIPIMIIKETLLWSNKNYIERSYPHLPNYEIGFDIGQLHKEF